MNPTMPVVDIANLKPVCIGQNMTILTASKVMRLNGVEDVVVTDQYLGKPRPMGIILMRDIVTRVIATELDPSVLTARDVLWSNTVIAKTTDTVSAALQRMRSANSRVIPLIEADGALAGIVSLDDLLLATDAPRRDE